LAPESDPVCKPVVGKIKVCNGDYGADEDWRGKAQLFLKGRYIVASSIRINDYYYQQQSETTSAADLYQYTLCHQFGHALGLFHSSGVGCMATLLSATTVVASEFLHPGQFSLDDLQDLYGQRRVRKRDLEGRSSGGSSTTRQDDEAEEEDAVVEEWNRDIQVYTFYL
jgi:hypothetical protein